MQVLHPVFDPHSVRMPPTKTRRGAVTICVVEGNLLSKLDCGLKRVGKLDRPSTLLRSPCGRALAANGSGKRPLRLHDLVTQTKKSKSSFQHQRIRAAKSKSSASSATSSTSSSTSSSSMSRKSAKPSSRVSSMIAAVRRVRSPSARRESGGGRGLP
jgi:hypothetical protein